jgi:hypothetical protein
MPRFLGASKIFQATEKESQALKEYIEDFARKGFIRPSKLFLHQKER